MGTYKGSSGSLGAIQAEAIAFVNDANGYSLLGISKAADFGTFRPLMGPMIQSLTFISQKEATDLQLGRLRVHDVKGGETWDSTMQNYFSTSRGKESWPSLMDSLLTKTLHPVFSLKFRRRSTFNKLRSEKSDGVFSVFSFAPIPP